MTLSTHTDPFRKLSIAVSHFGGDEITSALPVLSRMLINVHVHSLFYCLSEAHRLFAQVSYESFSIHRFPLMAYNWIDHFNLPQLLFCCWIATTYPAFQLPNLPQLVLISFWSNPLLLPGWIGCKISQALPKFYMFVISLLLTFDLGRGCYLIGFSFTFD